MTSSVSTEPHESIHFTDKQGSVDASNGKRRPRSDNANTQANLGLRMPHMPEDPFTHGAVHFEKAKESDDLSIDYQKQIRTDYAEYIYSLRQLESTTNSDESLHQLRQLSVVNPSSARFGCFERER